VAVAQNQFNIGADIDDELVFIMLVGLFTDQNADIVRSDKTGLIGQNKQIGGRVDIQTQIPGLDVHTVVNDRRERRQSHKLRIQAQKDVVHGGV
jgi:hypothetical protein